MLPFGRILYRIADVLRGDALEIGTGTGVSTAYIAAGLAEAAERHVVTIDTDEASARLAQALLRSHGLEAVSVVVGDQSQLSSVFLENLAPAMVHVDSDHSYQSMTKLLTEISAAARFRPIVACLDDIRWSTQMERAWSETLAGKFGHHDALDFGLWGVITFGPSSPRKHRIWHGSPPRGIEGARIEPLDSPGSASRYNEMLGSIASLKGNRRL